MDWMNENEEFRQQLIRYLAGNIYVFEVQLPGEDDPDVDTLWMVAEGMGLTKEVYAVYKYREAVDSQNSQD